MPPPSFDVLAAHRYFAIDCNNRAWDHVEAENAGQDEIEEMIHLAHAACYHWLCVGDVVNHLRAQNLLASAYIKGNSVDCAVRHAEKCLALSDEAGAKQSQFDRAMAHGCASIAFKLAGRADAASGHRARLADLIQQLEPDERKLVETLYLK